jgi:hypothetical protein
MFPDKFFLGGEISRKNLYIILMTLRRIAPLALLVLLLQAGDRYIHIEFPNGGEVLKSGSQVAILWSSLGVEGDLAILLFKGGEQYAVIAENVPDKGVGNTGRPAGQRTISPAHLLPARPAHQRLLGPRLRHKKVGRMPAGCDRK